MMILMWGFSPKMVDEDVFGVRFEEFDADEVPSDLVSAIPRPELAAVVSEALGRYVEPHPSRIRLHPGDVVWAAVYTGPRIQQDARTTPIGGKVKFYRVSITE